MMLAFQAPPDAVTNPVIKNGNIPGNNNPRQRSFLRKRYTLHTSFKSVGIAVAPAITLNKRYHWVPSRSKRIEPTPNPPPTRISNSKIIGNNAVAGTDAATCTMGCAIADSFGFSPIITPAGIVHKPARNKVNATRSSVAPAPTKMPRNSPPVTCASNKTIFENAYKMPPTAAAKIKREIQGHTRDGFSFVCSAVRHLAKYKVSHSLAGRTVYLAAKGSIFELFKKSRTGDAGASVDS